MAWLAEVSPIRALGVGVWLLLVLGIWRARGAASRVHSGPSHRLLFGLALGVVAAWAALGLGVVPAGSDNWLYLGYARWIAGNLDAWPSLFTELVNPAEPTIRLLPLLWMGFDTLLFGEQTALWAASTLVAHVATAGLVVRFARRLNLDEPAARLAGLVFLAHPVATESLLWLSTGRETILMTALLLVALSAHLDGRWGLAGIGFALALLSREHALAFLVLAPLCDWCVRRRWAVSHYAGYLLLVVVPMFAWRSWLFEADNAVQASYLGELWSIGVGTVALRGAVDVLGWLAVPFVDGGLPGAAVWTLGIWTCGAAAIWRWASSANRSEALRWGAFCLVFAWALVGPSVLDLEPPTSEPDTTRLPDWNLRHLYAPAVGAALALGAMLRRAPSAISVVAVALLMVSAVGLSHAYRAPSYRVDSARQALDSTPLDERTAVRFVQPQDAAAVYLLNRRILEPSTTGAPILVGEPRCGCVIDPVATDVASVPRLRDVWPIINAPLDFVPEGPGGECRCTPWRADATYVRLDGARFVPDGLP